MASNQEKGGYDVEFVGFEPKNVSCSICLFVLREPMQAEECGHRFCRSCIDDLKDNSDKITCPQDRIVNKVFRDKGKERDILDYVIKCTNASNGCQWTGELRDLEKHKENCEYQMVSCKNEGCNEEVQRRHLLQHVNEECSLRIVNCEYCKIETIFCDLEEHNRECLERPVQCSRCKRKDIPKEMVKRDWMSSHKEDSTSTHFDCIISKFREQEKHLEIQLQHQKSELDQQTVTINRQKEQLEEQKITITGLQQQIDEIFKKFALQEGVLEYVKEMREKMVNATGELNCLQPIKAFKNDVVWVIDNFNRKFEGGKYGNITYINKFFTRKGYKCWVDLRLIRHGCVRGTNVSLYLRVEEGPFDDTLVWPIYATIHACVLKNGIEVEKQDISTTGANGSRQAFKKPPTANNLGFGKFLSHDSITNFIVNDTVTFKISIEFNNDNEN